MAALLLFVVQLTFGLLGLGVRLVVLGITLVVHIFLFVGSSLVHFIAWLAEKCRVARINKRAMATKGE